jgi:hypothetical protein
MASHTSASRTILEEEEDLDDEPEDGPHMLFCTSFEEEMVMEALHEKHTGHIDSKACAVNCNDDGNEEGAQLQFPFSQSLPSGGSRLLPRHRAYPSTRSSGVSCPVAVADLGPSLVQLQMATSSSTSLFLTSNSNATSTSTLSPRSLTKHNIGCKYHRRSKSTTDLVASSMQWIQSSLLAETRGGDSSGNSNSSSNNNNRSNSSDDEEEDDSITQEYNVARAREQKQKQQLGRQETSIFRERQDRTLDQWFNYATMEDNGLHLLAEEVPDVPWVSFHGEGAEDEGSSANTSGVSTLDFHPSHEQSASTRKSNNKSNSKNYQDQEEYTTVKRGSTHTRTRTTTSSSVAEEEASPFLLSFDINEGCEGDGGLLSEEHFQEQAKQQPGVVSCSFQDDEVEDDE